MDNYTACLIGWFYGIEPTDAMKKSWTQEDIDRAQDYCELKRIDPVEYWRN